MGGRRTQAGPRGSRVLLVTGLFFVACIAAFGTAQAHLSMDGIAHSGLSPPTLVGNEENALLSHRPV